MVKELSGNYWCKCVVPLELDHERVTGDSSPVSTRVVEAIKRHPDRTG